MCADDYPLAAEAVDDAALGPDFLLTTRVDHDFFGPVGSSNLMYELAGNFGTDGTFPSATPLFGEGELRLKPCEGSTASTSAFLWNQGSVRCIFDLWHEPFVPQRAPGLRALANSSQLRFALDFRNVRTPCWHRPSVTESLHR